MTLYLLDLSSNNGTLNLALVKKQGYTGVTARLLSFPNGNSIVVDPSYNTFKAEAKANGLLFSAYILFHTGFSVATQVALAKQHIGDLSIPIMIDAEPDAPSTPSFAFVLSCYDELVRQALKPKGLYNPHWYWSGAEGSPDLAVRPWHLVSSNYGSNNSGYGSTEYASLGGDTGPGWASYGGLAPTIWQFGSQIKIDGYPGPVDGDAFRGSVAQLNATGLFTDQSTPPVPPPPAHDRLISADGKHVLVMQSDGNLVIYKVGGGATWQSGTAGK